MNNTYKLVIFDWDGTLVDSIARIVFCLSKTIEDLSLSPKSDDNLKSIIGLGLPQAIYSLYPSISQADNEIFANRYREIYTSTDSSVLFNGIEELLDSLKKSGVMLAIATGKGRGGLNHSMHEVGLVNFFQATRCADETFSKPNPKMLEEIIDEFAITANEAIMIGDTEYDLQMANNLNMASIGVTYGVHDRERLNLCRPKIIVDDVEQLSHYLHSVTEAF